MGCSGGTRLAAGSAVLNPESSKSYVFLVFSSLSARSPSLIASLSFMYLPFLVRPYHRELSL